MSSSLPLSRETPNEPFGRPSFLPADLGLGEALEDGEALAAHVLLRGRDPQIDNGFHGLTMEYVTFHATELFGQNERLFLTEPCWSPTPTSLAPV